MALTTAKITLPTDVAVGIVNKASDTSTIAALSPSTPMLFRNQDYMVFNPASEAEVVEEGANKSAYEQFWRSVDLTGNQTEGRGRSDETAHGCHELCGSHRVKE